MRSGRSWASGASGAGELRTAHVGGLRDVGMKSTKITAGVSASYKARWDIPGGAVGAGER
ncbi:hypothetical protein GCM10017788_69970 [Amycolatopsis acidiphila]|nr:hypothetical protein GCM10017788_69970 [Amycolatopsis acidiphila]